MFIINSENRFKAYALKLKQFYAKELSSFFHEEKFKGTNG